MPINGLLAGGGIPEGALSGFLAGRNDAIGLEELGRQRSREDFDSQVKKWDFEQQAKDAAAFGDLRRRATAQGFSDDLELSPLRKQAKIAELSAVPENEKFKSMKQKLDQSYIQLGVVEELSNLPDLAFADPTERERIKQMMNSVGLKAPEPGGEGWKQWIQSAAYHARNTRPKIEAARKHAEELEKVMIQKQMEAQIHAMDNERHLEEARIRERGYNNRHAASTKFNLNQMLAARVGPIMDKILKAGQEGKEPELNPQELNTLLLYQQHVNNEITKSQARSADAGALGVPAGQMQFPLPTPGNPGGGAGNPQAQLESQIKAKTRGLPVQVSGNKVVKQNGKPIGVGDRELFNQLKQTLPKGSVIETEAGPYEVK
jgi:hypothetical protein